MKMEFSSDEVSFTGGLDKPLETKGSYTIPELFHPTKVKKQTPDDHLFYLTIDRFLRIMQVASTD